MGVTAVTLEGRLRNFFFDRPICSGVTMRLSDLFLYHTSTLQALKDNHPAYYLQLVARLRLNIRCQAQGEWSIDWHLDSFKREIAGRNTLF